MYKTITNNRQLGKLRGVCCKYKRNCYIGTGVISLSVLVGKEYVDHLTFESPSYVGAIDRVVVKINCLVIIDVPYDIF